jgi:hypothetical protein
VGHTRFSGRDTFNIGYRTNVTQYTIITLIDSLGKIITVAHANFLLEVQHGLEIRVAHVNSHYED